MQNIFRRVVETWLDFLPHRQQVALILIFTVGLGAVSYWAVSFLQRRKDKPLRA